MPHQSRVQNIFSHCDPVPDAIFIKNASGSCVDKNFFYVSNLTQGLFEGCGILLFPDGKIHLFVSPLEYDLARSSSSDIVTFSTSKEFFERLVNLTSSCKTIGIPYQNIPHSDVISLLKHLPQISFQDVSNACISARMRKDSIEIYRIKKACEIADRVMDQIAQFVHKGMTESELAAEIDYHLQKYGAQSPAFETISSFGKNSALPHYSHGNSILQTGDLIVCDFGARYDMYNSDMTRTFIYGKATEKQKHMHQTVLHAQAIGLQSIYPGAIAKQVHSKVFDVIASTDFADRFIHSTGHSLGLDVHDNGVGLNSQCNLALEEGMVFTVEPGVYIPNYGGVRIEDDVVVSVDGCTCLTKCARDLIEL